MSGDQNVTVSRDNCNWTLAMLPIDYMTEKHK